MQIPELQNYNGSKGGNGVYQQIISLIPPHRILVVPFLGHCGIIRNIAPTDILICVDASEDVINAWKNYLIKNLFYIRFNGSEDIFVKTFSNGNLPDKIHLYKDDAIHFLPNRLPGIISQYTDAQADVLVYQDPPYPKHTRKSKQDLYVFEMNDTQHQDLLSINLRMPYKALLSTYDNNLYNTTLESWNKHSFGVGTRKGKAVETVYYNYDLSNGLLHDYSYLGKNFKDRERIRLKIDRWVKNLEKLDARERMAIISEILKNNTL